jgi:hypothetical protein
LFSAAQGAPLAYFLERNPWASEIPLVLFGQKGVKILEDTSGGIFAVHGYVGDLPLYTGADVAGQFQHIAKIAAIISRNAKKGPIFEIVAGASFGFLAMGAASVGRKAYAIAQETPGAPTLIMSDALGVDIDVITPRGPVAS